MDNMNLDLYEELNQLDIDDLTQEMTIEDLLHIMVEKGSSDLHLKAGCAPMIRVDGELVPITYELLSAEVVRRMIESILTEEQKAKFVVEKELDMAYSVPGLSRFRVNVFMQRNPEDVMIILETIFDLKKHMAYKMITENPIKAVLKSKQRKF